MKVSVIIAVYNHANYVRQSVESALDQSETAEVLLVEDGSTDDSLRVCRQLATEDPRIRLVTHPDGKNHGYPASLNLGIVNATSEYIAFIDADDFYLPDRFAVARELFAADPTIDGVYEAIGIYIDSPEGVDRWLAARRSLSELHTITRRIPPEKLFEAMIEGGCGHFSKDGLVVKKTVFDKTGLYDEHLRLHQDTAMNFKMALAARLTPGRLDEPVARWRVHTTNRIAAPRPNVEIYRSKVLMWYTVWRWGQLHAGSARQRLLLKTFLRSASFLPRFERTFPKSLQGVQKRFQLLLLLGDYPILAREGVYWQHFLPSFKFWLDRLRGLHPTG